MDRNNFTVNRIFQNNMILQREKPLKIWGTGPEGEIVTVAIQGITGTCRVQSGRWEAEIAPLRTSFGEELAIRCCSEDIVLGNILVGEVWIAGGQSNMEFFVRYDEGREQILREGGNPNLRFYDVPRVSYPEQLKEADYSRYGVWRTCERENIEYFSAVGYYFSSLLNRDLEFPVGIIGCNWGGSPACTWMDIPYLEESPQNIWLKDYEQDLKSLDLENYEKDFKSDPANFKTDMFSDEISESLLFGMDDGEMESFMNSPSYSSGEIPVGPLDFRRPSGLYHAMLMQVVPFPVRGILWYQGESDSKHPEIYDVVLEKLIRCWRDAWGEELPFLFVQLAPFRKWLHCLGSDYPLLRDKQARVSRSVPGAWLASIMDAGMENDIHPKKKKPVGERLALLAKGHVYGKDILCDSPELIHGRVEEGRIVLSFCHGDDGFLMKGESVKALELFIENERAQGYNVILGKGEITLIQDGIAKKSRGEIRFAWKDYCEVNLYNRANLPVKPFIFRWGEN